MALMKILHFPDPRLRNKGRTIDNFADPALQTLIDDMFETMYDARGVGLAATQVGVDLHLAVMDVTNDKTQPLVLINAEILEAKNKETMVEGCLSVPHHYDTLERATWVKMRAFDRHGKSFELEGEGVLAECIQHELDHLQGK